MVAEAMATAAPRRRSGGRRGLVLVSIAVAGLLAGLELGLDPRDLVPGEGGLTIAGELFSSAFRPALTYQATDLPANIQPLPVKALEAARVTVILAAAAISLSVIAGLILGFLASTAWWAGDAIPLSSLGDAEVGATKGLARRAVRPAIYGGARILIAFMRSIHELLWALLLLIVLPTDPTTAIIAIAIPYGGTLAKIFSEMIDEAGRRPAYAMRAAGASGLQTFTFGLLPAALPDMTAYTFYRFECALRSAAILGFFGFTTLGLRIKQAFENGDFGEVWTHLYMLFLLIVIFDWWSGALRRRMVR